MRAAATRSSRHSPAADTGRHGHPLLPGADRRARGRLWRCGDPQAFTAALLQLAADPPERARAAARGQFESELSFAALGRKLVAAYTDLLAHARAGDAAVSQARAGIP